MDPSPEPTAVSGWMPNCSNNILPTYLVENEYDYKYTLDEAFADWKKDCPEEWY